MPYEPRDTYKYHLKKGNRIVHTGITKDLARREQQHQARFPGTHIVQVGRRTTRSGALAWEADMRKKGYPTGP